MAADGDIIMENKGAATEKETNDVAEEKPSSDEVADLPGDALLKHPLHNTWTLWFFKMEQSRSWEDSQMEIASFSTVEDFWALYNHIEVVSKLKIGCDYSLFKSGIKPMWEDDRNINGGRWLINLNKQQRSTELDRFWMELLLLLIGESFGDHSDEVCGAVVNVRQKGDKIGIWTADAKNEPSIMRIGEKVKDALQIPRKVNIGFQAHKDAAKRGSSIRMSYTV